MSSYPEIQISRDLFHHASSNLFRDDRRTVLVPVNESMIKRITRLYFEDGLTEALNEAINPTNSSQQPIVSTIAKCALRILEMGQRVQLIFRPHYKDQSVESIGKFSQAR